LNLPDAAVVFSIGIARIAMVARGHFLTIASGHVFKFFGPDMAIRVLPIDLSGTSRPIGIVTLKNRTLAPVVQVFIDCAHELAKRRPAVKPVRTGHPKSPPGCPFMAPCPRPQHPPATEAFWG